MRVGVYVDAFNVYYGGKDLCGRGVAGWRWLDLTALAESLLDPVLWPAARVTRIVYCTALRASAGDPTSLADQQTYLAALQSGAVPTAIALGQYVPRVKSGHLVVGYARTTTGTISFPTRPGPMRGPPAGDHTTSDATGLTVVLQPTPHLHWTTYHPVLSFTRGRVFPCWDHAPSRHPSCSAAVAPRGATPGHPRPNGVHRGRLGGRRTRAGVQSSAQRQQLGQQRGRLAVGG